jgi:hypothetical protein
MKNLLAQDKPPVCLHVLGQDLANSLHYQGRRAYNACAVLSQTPHIVEYLKATDPMALKQLLDIFDPMQPSPQGEMAYVRRYYDKRSIEFAVLYTPGHVDAKQEWFFPKKCGMGTGFSSPIGPCTYTRLKNKDFDFELFCYNAFGFEHRTISELCYDHQDKEQLKRHANASIEEKP